MLVFGYYHRKRRVTLKGAVVTSLKGCALSQFGWTANKANSRYSYNQEATAQDNRLSRQCSDTVCC